MYLNGMHVCYGLTNIYIAVLYFEMWNYAHYLHNLLWADICPYPVCFYCNAAADDFPKNLAQSTAALNGSKFKIFQRKNNDNSNHDYNFRNINSNIHVRG